MKKENFRKIVWLRTKKRIITSEFNSKNIIFWGIYLIIVIIVLLQIFDKLEIAPVELWVEILIMIVSAIVLVFLSFICEFFWIVPKNIYNEQKKIINNLEQKYAKPNLEFSILTLGEAYKDNCRYASIVVQNNEQFPIDFFQGRITGFSSFDDKFKRHERINYYNPGGRPVLIDGEDKNSITLIPNGGKVRFDLVRGDGIKLYILNHNAEHDLELGDWLEIRVRFTGIANGNYIIPVEKIFSLSCCYKTPARKTGIYIVSFEESEFDYE